MSQIVHEHSRRVLSTFQAYLQAVETLKAMTQGTEILIEDVEGLTIAEARVHTFHNVQKMIEDDRKTVWVRERVAALNEKRMKQKAADERIRNIVREVLAEVRK